MKTLLTITLTLHTFAFLIAQHDECICKSLQNEWSSFNWQASVNNEQQFLVPQKKKVWIVEIAPQEENIPEAPKADEQTPQEDLTVDEHPPFNSDEEEATNDQVAERKTAERIGGIYPVKSHPKIRSKRVKRKARSKKYRGNCPKF